MATVKIVLRKKLNKDGTMPLCLRITKDRKASFIHLGYSLHANDWDEADQRVKKSYPNAARLNNYLVKKLSEAMASSLEIETEKPEATTQAVREKIKPKAGSTFFEQAELYLKALKEAGKYNQYTPDKPRIKHFRKFLGRDIAFQDITPALLERFQNYLRFEHVPVKGKGRISERSVANNLVTIRSVFSFARKQKAVDPKHSPFGEGKTKIVFPESKKVGLTPEEVVAIEKAELQDHVQHHVRNLWLISFYFAGMRASDVLRLNWQDIHDGRLHYTMGKNNKGGSLKIPDKAAKILEEYKVLQVNKDDLVFPELKGCDLQDKFITQRTISFKISALDKCLRTYIAPAAGIDKTLTMHIARHTFGNISGEKIHVQMLQKLYRHSHISTTINYQQNFIHKEADDALAAVLEFESKTPN